MSNTAVDFANEDSFGVAVAEKPVTFAIAEKPVALAAADPAVIADEVTLEACEKALKSIADLGATALIQAESMVISTAETAIAAKNTATELKKIGQAIDKARKDAGKPFNDFVSEINARGNRYALPFNTAATTLGNKVIAWQNAENKRIQEEKRRQEEEAQKALLAGEKPAAPAVVLPKAPVKAIATRTDYTFEIIDFAAVPDTYKKWVIDEEKLGQDVKTKAVTAVPGVKIITTEVPIHRR